MSGSLRIENLDAVTRMRSTLATLRDGGAKVIQRAKATLQRRLPVEARRLITAKYNIPAGDVRKRVFCTADDTSVTIIFLGRPFTLIKFGARQNGGGVAVQIRRGSTVQIPHAFIRKTRTAGAGQQVLIRNDAFDFGSMPDQVIDIAVVDHNRHGYPIVLLGGPATADMARDGDTVETLNLTAGDVLSTEVDRLAEVARGQL